MVPIGVADGWDWELSIHVFSPVCVSVTSTLIIHHSNTEGKLNSGFLRNWCIMRGNPSGSDRLMS